MVVLFNSVAIIYIPASLTRPASQSLRYNRCYTPPKITPHPPATLPGISIHDLEIIHQTRVLELSNIRTCGTEAQSAKCCPTSLVQIQLQWLRQAPGWEVCRRIAQGITGGANSICNEGGNRRIILRDEVTPNCSESCVEI